MEKTRFGESVFGDDDDDDDDDDVKKNELKTRGGCPYSSTKTGDQKACRIVASSNARRRQTDRISKTKKDIISLDPHKQTTTTEDDDDKQSRFKRTTNRKEEKSHHPPDTRDEVDDQNRTKRRRKRGVPSWVAKRPLAREKKQTFLFVCVCDVSFSFISLLYCCF